MKTYTIVGVAILLAFTLAACSKPDPGAPRLTTSPVSGVVHLDGKPVAMIEVKCQPDAGMTDIKHAVTAMTGEDGRFELGTYVAGDGLPAGEYKLTFTLMEGMMNPKDRLKGKYKNPKKSQHSVTVKGTEGEKVDLGTIELKTK